MIKILINTTYNASSYYQIEINIIDFICCIHLRVYHKPHFYILINWFFLMFCNYLFSLLFIFWIKYKFDLHFLKKLPWKLLYIFPLFYITRFLRHLSAIISCFLLKNSYAEVQRVSPKSLMCEDLTMTLNLFRNID